MYIRHRVRCSGEYAKPVARGRLDPVLALFFPTCPYLPAARVPGPTEERSSQYAEGARKSYIIFRSPLR